MELPPRTRRIPQAIEKHGSESGTTSAYAENTLFIIGAEVERRNYLRVRGEYPSACGNPSRPAELPPRTRRIQSH